jgi:membrane protease YdiL (CAAX protease family)
VDEPSVLQQPDSAVPLTPIPAAAAQADRPPVPRWLAIIEVIAVSGVPSQFLIVVVLWFTTNIVIIDPDGNMPLEFISTMMFLDTALIAILIRVFLAISGEDSRPIFIGRRPIFGEIWRGLAFLPVVFIGVWLVAIGLRVLVPSLHTVEVNPLEHYMRTPFEASVFIGVVLLGAGVKEELQRAFILHRFKQALGGMRLGLIITTAVFGLLHATQGLDAAIAIGLLGLFWGVLYAKRQSAVMGMTNHAAFDAMQIVWYVVAKSLGA